MERGVNCYLLSREPGAAASPLCASHKVTHSPPLTGSRREGMHTYRAKHDELSRANTYGTTSCFVEKSHVLMQRRVRGGFHLPRRPSMAPCCILYAIEDAQRHHAASPHARGEQRVRILPLVRARRILPLVLRPPGRRPALQPERSAWAVPQGVGVLALLRRACRRCLRPPSCWRSLGE